MHYSDQVDRANDIAERERENSLAAVRAQAGKGPVATGRCLHCDEITDDERRWCSPDCRNWWEAEADARGRNGYA